jgi:hypothetical protein
MRMSHDPPVCYGDLMRGRQFELSLRAGTASPFSPGLSALPSFSNHVLASGSHWHRDGASTVLLVVSSKVVRLRVKACAQARGPGQLGFWSSYSLEDIALATAIALRLRAVLPSRGVHNLNARPGPGGTRSRKARVCTRAGLELRLGSEVPVGSQPSARRVAHRHGETRGTPGPASGSGAGVRPACWPVPLALRSRLVISVDAPPQTNLNLK